MGPPAVAGRSGRLPPGEARVGVRPHVRHVRGRRRRPASGVRGAGVARLPRSPGARNTLRVRLRQRRTRPPSVPAARVRGPDSGDAADDGRGADPDGRGRIRARDEGRREPGRKLCVPRGSCRKRRPGVSAGVRFSAERNRTPHGAPERSAALRAAGRNAGDGAHRGPPPRRLRADVRARLAILAGAALLHLAGAFLLPLQEPDEGRYGDIAATMARTGDWLTPRLNGLRYYEKPPLYFWLGAASASIFGPTEFAVRLPSVLACLGTILILMIWARRAAGPTVELLAGVMGATTPLLALFAHMAMVDLVLAFLTTLALYAAWRGLIDDSSDRRWPWVFWGACALAMLTKGPV